LSGHNEHGEPINAQAVPNAAPSYEGATASMRNVLWSNELAAVARASFRIERVSRVKPRCLRLATVLRGRNMRRGGPILPVLRLLARRCTPKNSSLMLWFGV